MAPMNSVPDATIDPRWRAVVERDRQWDGSFVFAVTSTKIFCRPSCPSRRPREDRVRFYASGHDARAAGYRACKRCVPESASALGANAMHTPLVVRAISLMEDDTMTVMKLADALDVSRAHLQRVFTRLVGCTPAEWQRAQRSERLRAALPSSESVSSAAFDAGFDSLPSAYTAAAAHLGMSPGSLRRGAAGETVFYTIVPCALGFVLVAMTSRGVHRVVLGDDPAALEATLRDALHAADLVRDDAALGDISASVVALASGAALSHALPLDVRGTAFQQRVWRELQRIPRGETITYAELAARIGAPKAVRAVGTACGANPVAMVVPCHRVVRADGSLGGYAWGLERKERLLREEQLPTA
ncbi:bifunctional DNA-binding transcriptional regulator/O6-methylguanine-DNA methyltransferase Ada [Gemmatimonas groenlandica]|uniref:methylated-DNA--[protein]-cysteine S-methyltransferase n=1 Tax=Gemmatimonas groenlandica TaxID=2732249 RepID=A0A6M4IR40_9BACT|nr:bifunctional DNA-binding transcriptional regulator/O6-methylguanine-DNA methyltransferase Ada [Gemmatimonas groenlandica]QJR36605.1 bifunctional DNA-binding transcriptional regulator/O6-methylguanine-DNA methyltransferase Ada [Gemmatimonas groenlandica]